MKKFLFFLVFLAVLGIAMMVTCPKVDDHKNAICLVANQAIDEKVGTGSGFTIEGIINVGGRMAMKKVAEVFIDSNVEVTNYVVLSIGRFTFGNHDDIISVGVFNHVFTFSKDDVLRELEKQGL